MIVDTSRRWPRRGLLGPVNPDSTTESVCSAGVATEQIAVRLPVEQLAVLDDLVTRGVYDSRAAAVRAGIEAVVELDRHRQADNAIVNGYREKPPTDVERVAAMASLREAIAEEPW